MKKSNLFQMIIITGIALFLLALIVYPFIMLVASSYGMTMHDLDFTCQAYVKAFSDRHTLAALSNTLYVASMVTVMASLIGGGLAWLVTRTDLPFKRVVGLLIFLTFIIPSYIMAVAWIELLGHDGYFNRLLIDLLHLRSLPIEIYSLEGVIVVMTIHLYPLVFMALSNALKTTDPTLEKAAVLCGASRLKILFSITLPLVLPSVLSVGLLVFNHTMACFGVAAVLCLPASAYMLTTRIFGALNSLDLPLAAVVSMILVICSGFVFFYS
jgi:iron(III) transport system permease protein